MKPCLLKQRVIFCTIIAELVVCTTFNCATGCKQQYMLTLFAICIRMELLLSTAAWWLTKLAAEIRQRMILYC
jgi:hypothetical protein